MPTDSLKRIEQCLNKLEGHKAALTLFIPPLTYKGHQPYLLMKQLVEAGADILELGVPFRDPVADGPVIDSLYQSLIKDHIDLDYCLQQVKLFRTLNTETPVILMSYFNPVLQKGVEAFCQQAADAGVDGVIIVDYSEDNYENLFESLNRHNLDYVPILDATTGKHSEHFDPAFHYTLSASSTTGSVTPDLSKLMKRMETIKQPGQRYFVGFGLKSTDDILQLKDQFDGIIIGSELVRRLVEGDELTDICSFVSGLSQASYGKSK
ncbi:tryptophan synthase subunit alpha [Parendozoicomonas sp. Alg238-R29]|uniref:tryptophan synthase subunit alpha n=1 Tax=Parendozoicomonas sp. Alg238-R29 TaxID=2993446 RepID=UPI00248E6782|nr:tryptophan synthase subunit alpha [Parendozoicomonas sp. Alg238-R29]